MAAHADFPSALPSVLLDFLGEHPDAKVVVLKEPSFQRIAPEDAHRGLAEFEVAEPLLTFSSKSYATGVHALRMARLHGASHRILTQTSGAELHISMVALIGTPYMVLVTHPTAGVGPVTEVPDRGANKRIRGMCDDRLIIKKISGDLSGADADAEVLLGKPLIRLLDNESIPTALDCWLDAWSVGAATCEIRMRGAEEVSILTMIDLGDHVSFGLVEKSVAGYLSTEFSERSNMRDIADTVHQGFFRVSAQGELTFKNSKLDSLFGRSFETFNDFGDMQTTSGDNLVALVPKLLDKSDECVVDVAAEVDGVSRIIRLRIHLAPGKGGELEFVGSAEDVTASLARESQLELEALTDPLTGAANRRSLELSLDELLQADNYVPFALLLCDLDGFKQVNDSLGHGAGDEVIAEVGRRLTEISRDQDAVARLGGDEFVILATNVSEHDEAMEFAERILPRLRQPFVVAETQIELSGSVGVALSVEGSTVHGLLQMADHAMYEAKRAGRNQATAYHSPDASHTISPLALRRDLRRAIAANTLDLAFQPIFAIDNLEAATSAEALLRWEHPVQGRIDPSTMISIAEQSGLIRDLGEWIITEAIRSAASVNAEIPDAEDKVSIAVNVSALQVGRPEFVDIVSATLEFHKLAPELLTIELTESYLIDHIEKARGAIAALSDLGVRLAVDDFGTGYSTFQYLLTLPVSAVKIDPTFTRQLTEARGKAMLRGLSSACRELNMSVVAEGIETVEQLDAAREAGVTHAQGYLLGMPVSSSSTGMRANSDARTG